MFQFEDFLAHLLAQESGLHPSRFQWYGEHLDSREILYHQVASPGHPVLNPETGDLVLVKMTVREYFQALGVENLFDQTRGECLRSMQHAAINSLGFVGYQFGEAVLIKYGYYEPVRLCISLPNGQTSYVDSYYVGPVASWRAGITYHLHQATGSDIVIAATPINRWEGRFLGKNGVHSLEALRCSHIQEIVIRDILGELRSELVRLLKPFRIKFPECFPVTRKVSIAPGLPPIEVRCSASGVLAAAHLCGCRAVLDFFSSGRIARDEFGTSSLDYLLEFDGYCIDF
jgi:hypothetical protein